MIKYGLIASISESQLLQLDLLSSASIHHENHDWWGGRGAVERGLKSISTHISSIFYKNL